jgi:thioredoxin reductase (NADPH)
MKNVVVYSKDYCPYCVRAKELLSSKGVKYEEIQVDVHPERMPEMIEKANGGKTVPQIFIDEQHVGGCDDLYALEREGKLDGLLQLDSSDTETIHKKLIILGSGPAGYTAAIYAARANLSPMIITGPQKGGQLTTTTEVENFPGFPEGVDGNELMVQMEKQAVRFETEIVFGEITSVDLNKRPFVLRENNTSYTCDALIIATGASARYIGLESEIKYKNKGVSACATCDGFFFKGQKVAVVGGGDTALEEASYLTNFCEHVYLIHRRDELRGSKAMQSRVLNNKKITVKWDSVVEEVIGDGENMTDLSIKNVKTDEISNLGVAGMFVAIGHSPNTSLFKGSLNMDEKGYLLPNSGSTALNIEGVFACGDVTDSTYRQAITAAGTGCMAAIDAERWLASQE